MNAVIQSQEYGNGTLDPKHRIVEFASGASTEITTHDDEAIAQLAAILPPATIIYVAHTPKASLKDVVRVSRLVQASGLRASPHIVARRIEGEQALRDAARQLRDRGIDRALVIAGDSEAPMGPFSSSLDVLDSGILNAAGFTNIGVAGHPEGHRAVGAATLWEALRAKQAFAGRAGIRMHIVTQFGFDADAISQWAAVRAQHGVRLPVHPGMAGPAPLTKLVKYAMACGVGASLRSAMRSLQTMKHIAGLATTPEAMLTGLARAAGNDTDAALEHPHVFAFGGVIATAHWMRAVIDGRFELGADGNLTVMR